MTLGMRRLLLALALFGLAACASATTGQDPQAATDNPCVVNGQTYCAVNPDVTPATIQQTICQPGWDKEQRRLAEKQRSFDADKSAALAAARPLHPDWTLKNTEWDHRLAGGMGGSWIDQQNLSLQFADEPRGPRDTTHNHKDDDETAGHDAICFQHADLRATQAAFIKKWLGPGKSYAPEARS